MIVTFLQSIVRAYKKTFSASLLSTCRFTPTCSDYAMEALERHGAFFGGLLTLWRVLRCNPFSRGGLDIVPTKLHTQDIRTQTNQLIEDSKEPGERAVSAGSRERSARAKSLTTEPCN
jgi:uncharacterized protein